MKHDSVYLRHMLEAIGKIEHYLAGTDYETFSRNDMMIDGVVRELEIIGESARSLSPGFVEGHAGIPRRRIQAIRDSLIHQWLSIDVKIASCIASDYTLVS